MTTGPLATLVPGLVASPPLEDHRLLGDGRTTALVRPDGEVDWWCAPHPHAAPVLWSLLDRSGGATWVLDAAAHPPAVPAPVAGPVLVTEVLVDGARVELVDALLDGPSGSTLVRTFRALDRPATVRAALKVGGFGAPPGAWDGLRTTIDGRPWFAHVGGAEVSSSDGTAVAHHRLAPDDPPAVLVLTDDRGLDVRLDRLLSTVAALDAGHAREVRAVGIDRRVQDGLAVLRTSTMNATGAVLAAPTTSLPEVPGADRQFDYRYTWLRDGSLAAAVAAVVGETEVAGAYLGFLEELGPERILQAPLWTVDARPVPDERVVDGVAGWAGSQPIRLGNEARGQLQYDALGFVAEAIGIVVREGGELTPGRWALVESVADRAAEGAQVPTAGIWELREPRWLVVADIGRWMALDHGIRVAAATGRPVPPRWRRAHEHARRRVRAAVDPEGRLPQVHRGAPGAGRPDASCLLAVICGLLDPADPVTGSVVDACLQDLGRGPFLHRYPPDATDGFDGHESLFLPASFWAVTALATVGRVDEAAERLDALDAALPRLLTEEWDDQAGRGLGNTPLVWSHIESMRAAYAVDGSFAA